MVAAATDALASPADEEEAAYAQTADDDDKTQDGQGDDHAQIYARATGRTGSREGHARGKKSLGEDA